MANLLQKASIVLTPTAYDNGKVLCAKPSEPPYGDFDFSRNSAATRVNAQGLVENVQILSSNLVQNGDFSEEGVQEVSNGSFSQEGVQLITNGDFSSDTAWVKGTGTTISGGSANFVNAGGVSLYQSIGTQSGFVKITFNVTDYTSGTLNVYSGGNQSVNTINVSANALGTYTAYVDRNGGNVNIIFGSSDNFIGSIDNVSVRKVGQDWTLGTSWSIGEDKAISDGTSGNLYQSGIIVTGKQYKIQATVSDYVSGNVQVSAGAVPRGTMSANGTYTFYQTASSTINFFLISNIFNGSITNISVKEVLQDWTAINANIYLSNNQLVVDDTANLGFDSRAYQTVPTITGAKYRLTFDRISTTSVFWLAVGSGNPNPYIDIFREDLGADTGLYELEFVALSSTTTISLISGGTGISIFDNVSLLQVTDDTNLPRINYEGFSYQDALGSELITNGDFSNGFTNWARYGNTSVSNGVATIGASGNAGIYQAILNQNKSYKVTINVTAYNGVGQAQIVNDTGFVLYTINGLGKQSFIFEHTIPQLNLIIRGISNALFSIDNVSVKEYLGQEVVPDSGCGSWLWEPQSTNIFDYSSDLSAWSKLNSTVSESSVLSLDGVNNSYGYERTSSSSSYIYRTVSLANTTQYTLSFFVKSGTSTNVRVDIWDTTQSAQCQIQVDLETKAISNFVGTSYKIEDYTNGWIRVSVVFTSESSFGTTFNRYFNIDGVGSELYIWGAQLEQGSYATSYIPTSGSTVTRNQDVCNNGGSLASINSTSGTLYAEISGITNDGTFKVISLSDGSTSNVVRFYKNTTDNQLSIRVTSSGVNYFNQIFTLSNSNATNKVALKYKENDFAFWVNGIEVKTDNDGITPIGLNVLNFSEGNGVSPFYGKTKALAVWKEALTDQELTELTTI